MRAVWQKAGRSGFIAAATALGIASIGFLGTGAVAAAQPASAADCVANVADSGLSAAVVATSHETIAHKTIDAQGCDIGIFVGPGVTGVTIDGVKITGAGFQGIFAEKTSGLTVEHSTLTDNGFGSIDDSAPATAAGVHSLVSQSFAISLFGVSDSTVEDNAVFNNDRGGIGIMDNGPNDPGTITQDHTAALVASAGDKVIGNRVTKNYNGCAIVLATQNVGGSLSNLVVARNTVTGTGMSANGPDIGGIVVAADPPNSTVSDVSVLRNKVTGSWEGGLIVNAEAFNASTTDVQLIGNTAIRNNLGHLEAPNTAGIIVFAAPSQKNPPKTNPAQNVGTVLSGNHLAGQAYGVWTSGQNQIEMNG